MKSLPYVAAVGVIILLLLLLEQSRWHRQQEEQRRTAIADANEFDRFKRAWLKIKQSEYDNLSLSEHCRQSSDPKDHAAYARWVEISRSMDRILTSHQVPPNIDAGLAEASAALRDIQFPALRNSRSFDVAP